MVYRPRYLDKQRSRPLKKGVRFENGELIIDYSDRSSLIFNKNGVYRCDPQGNITHYFKDGKFIDIEEMRKGETLERFQ